MAALEFKFSSDQQHQLEAIEATCDLFRGQQFIGSVFSADSGRKGQTQSASSWSATATSFAWRRASSSTTCTPCRRRLPPGNRRPHRWAPARLHRRDGDRHRQDLYLCENHLRAKRPLRLEPVHHRGSVGGRPGGRLPFPADDPGDFAGEYGRRCGFSSTTPTASPRWTASPPTAPFRS